MDCLGVTGETLVGKSKKNKRPENNNHGVSDVRASIHFENSDGRGSESEGTEFTTTTSTVEVSTETLTKVPSDRLPSGPTR